MQIFCKTEFMRTLVLSIQLLYFFLNSVIFGEELAQVMFYLLWKENINITENLRHGKCPLWFPADKSKYQPFCSKQDVIALHSDFTRTLTHNPLLLLEHCHLKYFRNASVSEDVTRVQQISVFADKNVQISVEAKLHNLNYLHREREKEKERERERKRERESLFGCSMMPSSRSAPRRN